MTELAHPCEDDLRRLDRDQFLCAQFARPERRGDLYALHAFYQDVARAPDATDQPLLARMRVQWWKDALDGIYEGSPPHHPIAQALSQTVRARGLARSVVEDLLDARLDAAERPPPVDLSALEAYVEATAGTLFVLAARLLVNDLDDGGADVARHAGVAHGLIGVVRAVPFVAARRRCLLPDDLCAAAGLDREALYAGRKPSELAAVVQPILTRARQRAEAARAARAVVPREACPALLALSFADGYARRLVKAGFDPHHPSVARPSGPGMLLGAAWRAWRGRY